MSVIKPRRGIRLEEAQPDFVGSTQQLVPAAGAPVPTSSTATVAAVDPVAFAREMLDTDLPALSAKLQRLYEIAALMEAEDARYNVEYEAKSKNDVDGQSAMALRAIEASRQQLQTELGAALADPDKALRVLELRALIGAIPLRRKQAERDAAKKKLEHLQALQNIELARRSSVSQYIIEARETHRAVTHAIQDVSRRYEGTFMTARSSADVQTLAIHKAQEAVTGLERQIAQIIEELSEERPQRL